MYVQKLSKETEAKTDLKLKSKGGKIKKECKGP